MRIITHATYIYNVGEVCLGFNDPNTIIAVVREAHGSDLHAEAAGVQACVFVDEAANAGGQAS